MDRETLVDVYLLKGCCCSEAIVRAGLEMLGTPNEQLADAATAFCKGLHTGRNCGALDGGAMLLAMFSRPLAASEMIPQLVAWFDDNYGLAYGSIDCADIAGDRMQYKPERCKPLALAVFKKCLELLGENDLLPQAKE